MPLPVLETEEQQQSEVEEQEQELELLPIRNLEDQWPNPKHIPAVYLHDRDRIILLPHDELRNVNLDGTEGKLEDIFPNSFQGRQHFLRALREKEMREQKRMEML